jgi:hypothetical protein
MCHVVQGKFQMVKQSMLVMMKIIRTGRGSVWEEPFPQQRSHQPVIKVVTNSNRINHYFISDNKIVSTVKHCKSSPADAKTNH